MAEITEDRTSPPVADVEKEGSQHVDPKLEMHSHDADEAMKAFEQLHGEEVILDEATNKRLLRIIDWHLMPLMCLVYAMNYLDSMVPCDPTVHDRC